MKITKTTHILFIILAIIVVFSGSLKNGFVWDDKYLILDNPYVKSWDYLGDIFTTQLYEGSGTHSNFYRPFQILSFTLDYSVWELNPFGYRLTNLFLHVFNAILVYLILAAISRSARLAFLTSLFFGISPTISGITYYISARSDLLMALFIFLSILFFIHYAENRKKIIYALSILTFALAFLCKETAVISLAILFLVSYSFYKKTRIATLLPYFFILVIYAILRFSILNFAEGTHPLIDFSYPATIPLWRRILTDFKIILLYLRILLFPFGLHMDWFIEPARRLFQIDILLSIPTFIILIFVVRKISYKSRFILFGALWFLLGLLPVLNIYPVSVFFADGWLYVPCVGFFIIFSVIFQNIIRPMMGKILSTILILIFLIYYSLFTVSYGRVCSDSISLFRNILKYEEKSPFIHLTYNNLAMAYYEIEDYKKSIFYSKKSILSNPSYQDAYNNLGVTYIALGRPVKGISFFKKAISLKKDYASAYRNLAHAYSYLGLKSRALEVSKAVLKIDPDSLRTYCNLGYVFLEEGDVDTALEFFSKAAAIDDKSLEPHHVLGSLYLKNNRFEEALYEYEKVLKLGLKDYVFYNELAILYIKNDRFKEAERILRESLFLKNDQAEPHNNLGNLYSMFGHFGLAIEEYRKALEAEPENHGILDNIRKTKEEWKDLLRKRTRNG